MEIVQLMVVTERLERIAAEAAALLGSARRLARDRSALDYIRIFIGKANVVAVALNVLLPVSAHVPVTRSHRFADKHIKRMAMQFE